MKCLTSETKQLMVVLCNRPNMWYKSTLHQFFEMNEHSVLRNNCLDEKVAHINRIVLMVAPQILV